MSASAAKALMHDSPTLAESASGATDQRSAADPEADETTSDERATEEAATDADQPGPRRRRFSAGRVVAFGVLLIVMAVRPGGVLGATA